MWAIWAEEISRFKRKYEFGENSKFLAEDRG